MNIITYLKDPKNWIVVVLIIVGTLGYLYMNREYTRVTKEYEQKINVLDSTHITQSNTWKHDSLSMLDSIHVTVHKLDSMFTADKESSNTHQVIYKVVYKDSTVEITTTDTQILKERDQTIVSLNDSVATTKQLLTSLKDSIGSLKDSLGKKKVQVVTVTKTDSVHIAPGDKKFSIGGEAFVNSGVPVNINYGVDAWATYKILDPVYIGATLQKQGFVNWTNGYNLQAVVGVSYDF